MNKNLSKPFLGSFDVSLYLSLLNNANTHMAGYFLKMAPPTFECAKSGIPHEGPTAKAVVAKAERVGQ
jgi:hypothetical protein